MIEFISSELGVSIKANPLDSCVSGLRITLTSSYTRFSALSQDLISSLGTQTGKFPRKTVKLILARRYSVFGDLARHFSDAIREANLWYHTLRWLVNRKFCVTRCLRRRMSTNGVVTHVWRLGTCEDWVRFEKDLVSQSGLGSFLHFLM